MVYLDLIIVILPFEINQIEIKLFQVLGLIAAFWAVTAIFKFLHVIPTMGAHRFEEFPVSTELFDVDQEIANKEHGDW